MNISLIAKLTKVNIVGSKQREYQSDTPGHLEITFRVPTPTLPRKPDPDWSIRRDPPDEPQQEEEESKSAFKKRVSAYKKVMSARAAAQTAWETELEHHARLVTNFNNMRMQYAALTGLSAILANTDITLTITPAQQDVLPGFESIFAPDLPLLGAPNYIAVDADDNTPGEAAEADLEEAENELFELEEGLA